MNKAIIGAITLGGVALLLTRNSHAATRNVAAALPDIDVAEFVPSRSTSTAGNTGIVPPPLTSAGKKTVGTSSGFWQGYETDAGGGSSTPTVKKTGGIFNGFAPAPLTAIPEAEPPQFDIAAAPQVKTTIGNGTPITPPDDPVLSVLPTYKKRGLGIFNT